MATDDDDDDDDDDEDDDVMMTMMMMLMDMFCSIFIFFELSAKRHFASRL